MRFVVGGLNWRVFARAELLEKQLEDMKLTHFYRITKEKVETIVEEDPPKIKFLKKNLKETKTWLMAFLPRSKKQEIFITKWE